MAELSQSSSGMVMTIGARAGLSGIGSALSQGLDGHVAVAELRALADVDDVLPAELLADGMSALDLSRGVAAADLRLPPPPVRAASGDQLFRSFSSFVEKLSARELGASAEELKMGAILRGIHELEVEIRSQMSKSARI